MTQKLIESKIQDSMNKSFTSSPHAKSTERTKVKSVLKSMNKLKSKIGIDAGQNVELQSMTQRSGNFTSVGNRQSKSLQRGAYNPIHFKRSLPDIIQTKVSTNAAGILKIDKKCAMALAYKGLSLGEMGQLQEAINLFSDTNLYSRLKGKCTKPKSAL